jgi:hypothetical protein
MKRKLIILFLTASCFSLLIRASLVNAQTPTLTLTPGVSITPSAAPTDTQSSEDQSIILNILKTLFSTSGDAPDIKSVEEYEEKYLTPGAQNTVPPAQSVTPGPSPTPDANSECNTARKGYYACRLIEEIRRVCGGRVTSGNINCLDNINIPGIGSNIMGPAIGEMKSSAISTGALQCVGFVKAALYIMRGGDGAMLQGRGNAIDWMGNNPSSFAVVKNEGNQKLQDGDVPIWGYDTYGHIAIYIGDGQIAEGNFDANGQVNIRPVNESSPALVGWLRPL